MKKQTPQYWLQSSWKKANNYTNTDLEFAVSQVQFTVEYHTSLQNTCYNQTDNLNIMA